MAASVEAPVETCGVCGLPRVDEAPHATCMVISVSQVETFRRCNRLWWFEKMLKLPKIDRGYLTFGTVLHAVIERWLRADDQGNDPGTGVPVDIYPAGWEVAEDGAKINIQEAALIKRLIEAGIEEGVLERRPGRKIEHEFWMPVIEAHESADGTTVKLVGYIDLLLPGEIQDHKSSKSTRYAKSGAELRNDTQMLVYARVALDALDARRVGGEAGLTAATLANELGADTVVVRHNLFVKDVDQTKVRATSTAVTRAEIDARWRVVVKTAHKMLETRKLTSWNEVEGPASYSTCNDYGGCAYRSICSNVESVQDYQNRLARVASRDVHCDTLNGNGVAQTRARTNIGRKIVTTKSLSEKMAETRARQAQLANAKTNGNGAPKPAAPKLAVNGAKPANGALPPKAPVVTAKMPAANGTAKPAAKTAQAPKLPPQPPAPWAHPGQDGEVCIACQGSGVNSKRTGPCKICDDNRAHAGLPRSTDLYELAIENGVMTWTAKEGVEQPEGETVEDEQGEPEEGAELTETLAEDGAPEQTVSDESPEGETGEFQSESGPEGGNTPEPEADDGTFEDDTPQEEEKASRRERKTFTILVGVRPGRGFRPSAIVWFDSWYAEHAKLFAEAAGKTHFTELAPNTRKDLWGENVEQLLPTLKGKLLATPVMTDLGWDAKAALEALRPHATAEYVPY